MDHVFGIVHEQNIEALLALLFVGRDSAIYRVEAVRLRRRTVGLLPLAMGNHLIARRIGQIFRLAESVVYPVWAFESAR